MIGWSAGLTFRKLGCVVISGGSRRDAIDNADCTSSAAPSMSRSSSNCRVTVVDPWLLSEVIEVIPAIVENCRSSGFATEEAIVSGLAPGRLAETWIVGKSTRGRAATDSVRYPNRPVRTNASIISVVITGRRMHSSGRLTTEESRWLGAPSAVAFSTVTDEPGDSRS